VVVTPKNSLPVRKRHLFTASTASIGFPVRACGPDRLRITLEIEARIQSGVRAENGRRTRRASDIKPEPIAWLWKYWLARGKLHIIAGVPETGKTTIALSYTAIVSSGGEWSDETRATVGSVLIWTAEDDADDTLVPRLMRRGADLDRIHFIEEAILPGAKSRPFNPATDMLALVEKAKAIGDVAAPVETVLYGFTGFGGDGDGFSPEAGLIADKQGAVYGTTFHGGNGNNGTVFKLTPRPKGQTAWTETVPSANSRATV
jgi:putative DNA primase/helicase